ncbi:MAG: cytochrome c oxidase subunit II [Rhizobacter sp.]
MNESSVPSVFIGASPEAAHSVTVTWVLVIGATLLFVLVMGLLAAALWRRRRGPGSASNGRGWLLAGLALPAVLLPVLAAWLVMNRAQVDPQHDARALVVSITARSWWWEVRYDNGGGAGEQAVLYTANEIHLPAGRPVTLSLTSADVIHSFWVPALGGKVDMLPGRVLHLRLRTVEAGRYRGQCAEFCGEQHARMALQVVVHEGDGFDRWKAQQSQPAQAPSTPLAQQGWQEFQQRRCGACHEVRGLGPSSRLGPDLTHVGSRSAIGAGTLRNDEQALRDWVTDVQRHKPGARMPSAPPGDPGTAALAHFLSQLQ